MSEQLNQNPEVSIIVPVYRSQAFLRACIDSIAAQTLPGWECILVDDGSPDDSGSICDEAAERDSRFRVIHKPNGGVSSARNAALDAAKGRYVIFCDADDAIAPCTLETALAAQQRRPEDLICWQLTRDAAQLPQSCEEPRERSFSAAAQRVYLTTVPGHSNCNKLFLRSLIEQNGLRYDEAVSMAEDYQFGGRYLEAFFRQYPAAEICQLEVPLYYWRENAESATHQKQKPVKGAKVQYDPAEFPDYAAHMLKEYDQAKQALGGWQNLTEAELLPQLRTYLRRFAFAVWAAHARKEPLLPGFLTSSQVTEALALLRQHSGYTPYYLPFKMKNKWLLRRLYQSDETGAKRLYSLCYTLGYYALYLGTGHRWQQP